MEEAAGVRRAALAAVDDVEPGRLRARIEERIDAASMAPGVCTLVSARALREDPIDGITDRAAGVQLIYEGLRLTRRLARETPWSHSDDDTADLDILIADILVSRGFYLLARTEAADAAVAVVRGFGTDQTVRHQTGDPTLDRNLEADVLELAVIAGVTAGGGRPTPRLREYAGDLVPDPTDNGDDPLPAVARLTDGTVGEAVERLAADGVRTSADH